MKLASQPTGGRGMRRTTPANARTTGAAKSTAVIIGTNSSAATVVDCSITGISMNSARQRSGAVTANCSAVMAPSDTPPMMARSMPR